MPRSICDAAAKKKEKEDFLISKVLPMYHHPCNLTLLPSVITFRGRTTAGRMLMGWRWSLKRVTALQRRGPCHSRRRITYTKTDFGNGVVLSFVNAGEQLCLDLSILTDTLAHHHVNRLRVMECQFWQMTNKIREELVAQSYSLSVWLTMSVLVTFVSYYMIYSTTSPLKLYPNTDSYKYTIWVNAQTLCQCILVNPIWSNE